MEEKDEKPTSSRRYHNQGKHSRKPAQAPDVEPVNTVCGEHVEEEQLGCKELYTPT
jgi:hypothetical protein